MRQDHANAIDIFLIRHGTTDGVASGRYFGRTDMPLNAQGVREAEALARRGDMALSGATIASPLLRTRQTAERARPGFPYSKDDALMEMNFGRWEGHAWQDIAAEMPDAFDRLGRCDESFAFPGGESYREICQRVFDAATRLPLLAQDGRIFVFAHSGVIRLLLVKWLALPETAAWKLEIAPASLTHIRWFGASATLVRHNDTGHLNLRQES